MSTAYIGVGSNQDRHQSIEAGLRALAELASQWRLSTIYECPSVGFASHPFFNLMVEMETELALPELMKQLKAIELRCGRLPNAQKYQDRTLDLDIVLYGDCVSENDPVLPRPDIYRYPFVIQPLYELCPQRVIAGDGRTVEQIWQQAQDLASLTPVPIWFSINEKKQS
ncbi:2-amino-4-hydroxy-6-hydroxymethyldihydropteridine diphosphokinase [Vibrio cholerae]|uniref:2-amino-4-hydroxy-6- hydroxymethyldihydropteridine diphosphokinase n=1 Tax=Vibrio cholerae TaxID=666 RepID=UPI0022F2B60B|nr:2-amino-4-hydroxy-6-hydroxymethyldihydropteridine diphosphokinase [Vibrio cholerae]MDA5314452.1 2-amino-4-hydroxy-6-hydroxymethyldihydropteridine diphosphokinase [Vibrio cholerae]MDN6970771.1 2-amino-4-hydroxy-6-hydroxymethyldihydropteridine diphosphokinase [Vibrio cholerae]HEQ3515587.1 2-amino-4-hydroxy-6-hydroxymethyldihydropteridine diphosphokinase [Vibrio cholerae]HEQ3578680.1 2-amino-4-hydroxy-6-hydroxymethyldihydropteridine diphosphokinase [Vibrio cholerae]